MEDLYFKFSGQLPVERGSLLLAEPFMRDMNFQRAVVLICEHQDNKGSFGFVLNKPSVVTISEVTEDFYSDNPLYVGGPVEQNTLHFIHRFSDIPHAIPLKNGFYLGGDYKAIQDLAAKGLVNSSNTRFFMGYSGWGRMQLKEEMNQESWFVAHLDLDWVFDIEPAEMWASVLKRMGGRYKMYANYPTDARFN